MGALILSLVAASLLMGWCIGFMMGDWIHTRGPAHRQLPPATPRAIARVRRSSRANIRAALARAGIELHEPPPPVARPFVPLPVGDFETDHEETR